MRSGSMPFSNSLSDSTEVCNMTIMFSGCGVDCNELLYQCHSWKESVMLVKAHIAYLELDSVCGITPCTISLYLPWHCVFANLEEEEESYECQICCGMCICVLCAIHLLIALN
eukprot:12692930-Ditylum_brightwellii.AAC.1